jgi:hypothetical protein
MSYEVIPYVDGFGSRDARRSARAMNQIAIRGQVRQAEVDVETDIALGKIHSITATTGQGLGAVAQVAQAETALVQHFPAASGRLAFIAERHMFHVSDAIDDLQWKLRRK